MWCLYPNKNTLTVSVQDTFRGEELMGLDSASSMVNAGPLIMQNRKKK